jgi:hypothetical protein
VTLPKSCSFRSQQTDCNLPPSYILSLVDSDNNEYMIGAVCDVHKEAIKARIQALQSSSKMPNGKIKFNPVVILGTNCLKIPDEE